MKLKPEITAFTKRILKLNLVKCDSQVCSENVVSFLLILKIFNAFNSKKCKYIISSSECTTLEDKRNTICQCRMKHIESHKRNPLCFNNL